MTLEKYTRDYLVRSYETDRNNNLRIVTLLNIFQDMADKSAYEMGLGLDYVYSKGLGWVGSNYEMIIDRLPKMHERIHITSWPAAEKKVAAIREFEVFGEDGKSIIRASSQWVLLNIEKMRPVSLKENLPEYRIVPERVIDTDFPKIRETERTDVETKFRVRFDDIDLNRHVNNAVYVLWACEAVDPEFRLTHNPKHIEMSFKKEGRIGEKIKVITECDGLNSICSIQTYGGGDDRELARAKIEWQPWIEE